MSTDRAEVPAEMEAWLRRLGWSLASMPSTERDDIVEEARSHLREVLAAGRTPAEALAGFGRPEDYARRFIEERDIAGALASQGTGALLHVLARQVNRSVVAAIAAIGLIALSVIGLVAVVMLIVKLTDPVHAGLWRGSHQFFIGKIDDPANARELLGAWLFPLCACVLMLAWLIGRWILLWAVRGLARTHSSRSLQGMPR
jgi:hypothetical protein